MPLPCNLQKELSGNFIFSDTLPNSFQLLNGFSWFFIGNMLQPVPVQVLGEVEVAKVP